MTELVLTTGCKMAPTPDQISEIEDTLKTFADACNWINHTVPAIVRNSVELHHIVYRDVRAKFSLSANLAVRAINRKSVKQL